MLMESTAGTGKVSDADADVVNDGDNDVHGKPCSWCALGQSMSNDTHKVLMLVYF